MQGRLDQVSLEREELMRERESMEVRLTQPTHHSYSHSNVQTLRTTTESIGQAISSTTLIKNMVVQNASEMNERLQRQLIDLELHCT